MYSYTGYESEGGEWHGPGQIDGTGTTYSAPSVAIEQTHGERYIAAPGANSGVLSYTGYESTGGEWHGPGQIGTVSTPNATTEPASALNATTATLNGSVDPLGVATTYHFEYRTTTSYGTSIPIVVLVSAQVKALSRRAR